MPSHNTHTHTQIHAIIIKWLPNRMLLSPNNTHHDCEFESRWKNLRNYVHLFPVFLVRMKKKNTLKSIKVNSNPEGKKNNNKKINNSSECISRQHCLKEYQVIDVFENIIGYTVSIIFFSFERLFGTLKIQIQQCLQTLLRIITINAKNNPFHKFLRSLTFRYDRRMDRKKILKFKEKQQQPNNWFISQN